VRCARARPRALRARSRRYTRPPGLTRNPHLASSVPHSALTPEERLAPLSSLSAAAKARIADTAGCSAREVGDALAKYEWTKAAMARMAAMKAAGQPMPTSFDELEARLRAVCVCCAGGTRLSHVCCVRCVCAGCVGRQLAAARRRGGCRQRRRRRCGAGWRRRWRCCSRGARGGADAHAARPAGVVRGASSSATAGRVAQRALPLQLRQKVEALLRHGAVSVSWHALPDARVSRCWDDDMTDGPDAPDACCHECRVAFTHAQRSACRRATHRSSAQRSALTSWRAPRAPPPPPRAC
jgi:hypothetical protein